MRTNIELYWNDLPYGKENAISYEKICGMWGCDKRNARKILHELSCYDDGSDMVLIRSSSGNGFYKTDDLETIKAFKNECLEKGRSVFAPVRKINRILSANATQFNFKNNMRLIRNGKNMTLSEVVQKMKEYDSSFDKPMLSKMENNVCLPTFYQLLKLSEIYGCKPDELVNIDLFM